MTNDIPQAPHPRVTANGNGSWTITSSGDPVVDALTDFFWHATGALTPEQACHMAEKVKDMLIDDDDALEFWGVRLTAEVPDD